MQYQTIPVNPNKKSKRDIFPEKYHLELQKNTSNFKSEWTHIINELQFQDIILKLPETNANKNYQIIEKKKNEPLFIEPNNIEFELNSNPNPNPNFPKPIYEKEKTKEKEKKKTENLILELCTRKSAIIYSNFVPPTNNNNNNNNIIPKYVFMCWSTLQLPSKMQEVVHYNQSLNPEFTFYIYDDEQCKEFIQNHFENDVVHTFNKLVPGAYKADLWRLCVLFIYGGIYVDIKYKCINGFTFSSVLDKEYLTLDIPSKFWTNTMHGIYNGFMVSKPNNIFLWKCICKIVENASNLEYGKSCLFPTGPGLLGDIYFQNENNTDELLNKINSDFDCFFSTNIKNIILHNTAILEIYPEYRQDQKKEEKLYYSVLWNKRRIYNTNLSKNENDKNENENDKNEEKEKYNSIIPLKIYQTWYTKDLQEILQQSIQLLKTQNPEFEFYLYDDNDCRKFIETYFDSSVLYAFDALIPGAYKADLFRYCILYIYGGIYLDIKYYGINGFKFITLTEKEYLVQDLEKSGGGIYNALMICKPGNVLLWDAIQKIKYNVETKFYGNITLEPTGPILLKQLLTSYESESESELKEIELYHKEIYCKEKDTYEYSVHYFIYYRNTPILTFSNKYRELQKEIQNIKNKKPYYILWDEHNIYSH